MERRPGPPIDASGVIKSWDSHQMARKTPVNYLSRRDKSRPKSLAASYPCRLYELTIQQEKIGMDTADQVDINLL